MVEILPPSKSDSNDGESGARILQVGNLHYHGNDIAELRKLAQVSPELANKVINQRESQDRRGHASYRFGIAATVALLIATMAAFVCLLAFAGILQTAILVALILAVALLVRVILTGKWSDTSWFGKLMVLLAKALGADVSKDDPEPKR